MQFSIVVAFLAAISVVSTSPIQNKATNHGGKTFKTVQEKNPHYKGPVPGPIAYANGFKKFGVPVPDTVSAAAASLLSALAGAQNAQNTAAAGLLGGVLGGQASSSAMKTVATSSSTLKTVTSVASSSAIRPVASVASSSTLKPVVSVASSSTIKSVSSVASSSTIKPSTSAAASAAAMEPVASSAGTTIYAGTTLYASTTSAGSQGAASATPEMYDSEYITYIQVGTPPQLMPVDFDTGSADLWMFTNETPATQQKGQKIFQIGSSSTMKKMAGSTWGITYGDGSKCSGIVYQDTVNVGGVTVTSQAVESAQTVSSQFQSDVGSSGLLGLALSSVNTVQPQPQKTFFDNAKAALAAPVFTVNLKKGQAGNYNFGYINQSEYSGAISYQNIITSHGFWEITGSGYAVGSGSFVSTNIDAIVDTGTTLLYLPQSIVQAYYAQVPGSSNSETYGGYVFPCSEASSLPNFIFGVGSYRGLVPGSYINYAPADRYGTTCFGGIQLNTGIGFSIFGDILMKSQFVVFNGANPPQIGFAAKPL